MPFDEYVEKQGIYDEKWSDKDSVLQEVRKDGNNLEYAMELLNHDWDVVLAAIRAEKNGGTQALGLASRELRENPDLQAIAGEYDRAHGLESRDLTNHKDLH